MNFSKEDMDIDLFSEMVKGLILDNDEVTLPGLGSFVSEVVPSSFSDKGYTINPPYRRLSFRRRESGNARLLAEFYAKANGTDYETAERILSDFISGLRSALQTKKMVLFPGLGRLRATKENAFFFIADEDLDIYPYGVGLEPVSLKTHEETPDEVADGVAALKELLEEPVVATGVEEIASAESVTSTGSVTETSSVAGEEQVVEESQVAEVMPVVGNGASTESVTSTSSVTEIGSVTGEASVGGGASTSSATGEESATDHREYPSQVRKGRGWRTAAIVAASVVGAVALALGIFILLSHVAPDFIDSLLYTPEELRIINY